MPRPNHRNRNAEVDFKGEKRSNATHTSTTNPEARLYKKSPSTGATLCFMGHALMETRHGLVVQGDLTQADDHAARRAALDMAHRHSPGSTRRLTLGAKKGYSEINERTTPHPGHALSIKHRKRFDFRRKSDHPGSFSDPPHFRWAKTVGGIVMTQRNLLRLSR